VPGFAVVLKPTLTPDQVAQSILWSLETNQQQVLAPFTVRIAYLFLWGPFKPLIDWLLWKTSAKLERN
jgi:hypothetical protein